MGFLAPIAPYLTAASGVMSTVGSIQQGMAASAASKYNAKIAEQNAQLAKQKAAYAGALGEQKVALAGIEAGHEAGRVKAAQAASGIDVGTGSAAQVQKGQAQAELLNAANLRSTAARQAYGFQLEEQSDKAQAGLLKSEAKNAMTSGIISGAGSLLSAGYDASQYGLWEADKGIGSSSKIGV